MEPINEVIELMERLNAICLKHKLDVDLEARFKDKKNRAGINYLWRF